MENLGAIDEKMKNIKNWEKRVQDV